METKSQEWSAEDPLPADRLAAGKMETEEQKLPGEDPLPVDRLAPGRIETKGQKLPGEDPMHDDWMVPVKKTGRKKGVIRIWQKRSGKKWIIKKYVRAV